MKKEHKHRAMAGKAKIQGWTKCVAAPGVYCDGRTHGGVVYIDFCSCGYVRRIESNGSRKCRREISSGWTKESK